MISPLLFTRFARFFITAAILLAALPLQAATVTRTGHLLFGSLVPGATTGTVTISPSGARSGSGGVTLFNQGSASSKASFDVSGPAAECTISLPEVTLAGSNMTVEFVTDQPANTFSLSGAGSTSINVGGTLHVPANQPAGSFSADFTLTVNCI